jgi:hypothetical protein
MKSWALAIALFVASVASPFSPVRGEAKAEAPKVSVAQPQKRLALFLDGTWTAPQPLFKYFPRRINSEKQWRNRESFRRIRELKSKVSKRPFLAHFCCGS